MSLLFCGLLGFFLGTARAQGLVVQAVDRQGLAVPGVALRLTPEAPSAPAFEALQQTDRDGRARFADVPPGVYRLHATRAHYTDVVLLPVSVQGDRLVQETISMRADLEQEFVAEVLTDKRTVAARNRIPPHIKSGALPAPSVDELANRLAHDTRPPPGEPLGLWLETFPDPFRPGRHVLSVRVQAQALAPEHRPPLRLTVLVDVSGSMADQLPLIRRALRMLSRQLGPDDTIALVAYAGGGKVLLPPSAAGRRLRIRHAISRLHPQELWSRDPGIVLAYELAEETFEEGAENQVLLFTDGDVGLAMTTLAESQHLITTQAAAGVSLSTVHVLADHHNAALLPELAQAGKGQNHRLDTLAQAQQLFVDEVSTTLYPIAQDVSIQVPAPERLGGNVAPRQLSSGQQHTTFYALPTPPPEVIGKLSYTAAGRTHVQEATAPPGAASRASQLAYAAVILAEVLQGADISAAQLAAFAEDVARPGHAADAVLVERIRDSVP